MKPVGKRIFKITLAVFLSFIVLLLVLFFINWHVINVGSKYIYNKSNLLLKRPLL